MIQFGVEQFLLYGGPVDMRKGTDGLSALVQSGLGRNPATGEAFVFIGRRRDRLKVLFWQGGGFWLCQHRLARGRFRLPEVRDAEGRPCAVRLTQLEWQILLEGLIVERCRRLPRFAG